MSATAFLLLGRRNSGASGGGQDCKVTSRLPSTSPFPPALSHRRDPTVPALGSSLQATCRLPAATSSTIPTCDWDLQSRDSSAPAVLRQFLLPLQEAAREQGSGPESCRTDCCPRRSMNRQEGKSGFFFLGGSDCPGA
uniref:Uncharacterized protein n=1 Tax=Accipiter nisus TaxID=211598 RepID=A0A8B9MIE8_9AVES